MKLTRNRKMHRFFRATEGIFGRNVVLISGFMLPYIVMPAVSLKTAVALTVAMLFTVLLGVLAARLVSKQNDWVRYIVVTLAALGGVALSRFALRLISTEIFDSLGIYLPLMAVNSIVVLYAALRADRDNLPSALIRGLSAVVGFGLVACAVGALRELLLTGAVWGVPVTTLSFPAAGTVFFGFILLAFFSAAVQALRRLWAGVNLRLDNPTAEELKRQQEERMVD
ncbi:MAG: hypothetical protein J6Q99_03830 [Oscillospiraceae bacterium]|nr:hypothetical protein [Oscillospiraceae bacterium]